MPGPANTPQENKVFSAPLAIIEIGGQSIGYMKDLNFTENVQRAEVQGIGRLTLSEVPPISIRCSFTASSYLIDFNKLGTVPDPFWPVQAKNASEFANTMILGEVGVNIHLYSKIPDTTANTGTGNSGVLVTSIKKFKMGIATNCFLDSRTFQVSENQIAGKNISGKYLEPISSI